MVRLLLDRGASTLQTDKIGRTPLYYSVSEGYTDVVQLLLEEGAEPNKDLHNTYLAVSNMAWAKRKEYMLCHYGFPAHSMRPCELKKLIVLFQDRSEKGGDKEPTSSRVAFCQNIIQFLMSKLYENLYDGC